VGLEPTTDGL